MYFPLLPNVFPPPSNTWFPAVSEILLSTILVTIAILDSHNFISTWTYSHTCSHLIIIIISNIPICQNRNYLKIHSDGTLKCKFYAGFVVGRNQLILYFGIFCLSSVASVCHEYCVNEHHVNKYCVNEYCVNEYCLNECYVNKYCVN